MEIRPPNLVKHFSVEKLLKVLKFYLVFQTLVSFENAYKIVTSSCNSCYSESFFYLLSHFKFKDQFLICLFIWVTKFSENAFSTVCLHTAWNNSSKQGVNCPIHLNGVLSSKSPADNWDINIFNYLIADHLSRSFQFVFLCYPKWLSRPVPSQVPKISAA